MYILNRSNFKAIDAQNGKTADITMYDYNYYYGDQYYDERYYYNNNIQTDEKVFTPGEVIYNADISSVTESPYFSLSSGYVPRMVSGKLSYYSNANGSENSIDVIQINFVPSKFSRQRELFAQMFDEGNFSWLQSQLCDTALIFARAYIDAESGTLIDYVTLTNPDFSPSRAPSFNKSRVDRFVASAAKGYNMRHYGTLQLGKHEQLLCYARYHNGIRVIGEGVCVIYNSFLREVTGYCRVVTDSDFIPVSFMKTHSEMKSFFEQELSLGLYYADKNETSKFVIYDVTEPGIAFDPLTGNRIDRPYGDTGHIICTCSVGSEEYIFGGVPYIAAPPIISSDKLFVPLSAIAPLLGYTVSSDNGAILISDKSSVITLSQDSNVCTLNGEDISLDMPPLVLSDNIYVSAQSIREIFGLFISWNSDENLIYLIK